MINTTAILTNENALEFETQLMALFNDKHSIIINTTERDFRTTFVIEVENEMEESWVEMLVEEIEEN